MGFPGNRLSVIDINWPWLIANCRLVKVGLGVPSALHHFPSPSGQLDKVDGLLRHQPLV